MQLRADNTRFLTNEKYLSPCIGIAKIVPDEYMVFRHDKIVSRTLWIVVETFDMLGDEFELKILHFFMQIV